MQNNNERVLATVYVAAGKSTYLLESKATEESGIHNAASD